MKKALKNISKKQQQQAVVPIAGKTCLDKSFTPNRNYFYVLLENLSDSEQTAKLFDVSRQDRRVIKQYRFATNEPLQPGYWYSFEKNGVEYSGVYPGLPASYQEVADLLTALGHGTWYVDTTITGVQTYYINDNDNVFNNLRVKKYEDVYTATVVYVCADSQVKVSGTLNLPILEMTQLNSFYNVYAISMDASNVSQLNASLTYYEGNSKGISAQRQDGATASPYQYLPVTEKMPVNWMLDGTSEIQLKVEALATVKIWFYYKQINLMDCKIDDVFGGKKYYLIPEYDDAGTYEIEPEPDYRLIDGSELYVEPIEYKRPSVAIGEVKADNEAEAKSLMAVAVPQQMTNVGQKSAKPKKKKDCCTCFFDFKI